MRWASLPVADDVGAVRGADLVPIICGAGSFPKGRLAIGIWGCATYLEAGNLGLSLSVVQPIFRTYLFRIYPAPTAILVI